MEQRFTGKVATKAIIVRGDEILMTRDNKDIAIWDLPGGRINVGENIEIALKREIMEELGVDIGVESLHEGYQCLFSEEIIED